MWPHPCRHRGQRCDDCAPFHFNFSCLSPSVRSSSARWPALGNSLPARSGSEHSNFAHAPFFLTGTAQVATQVATQVASGAAGCHLAATEEEAGSRPGQRPSASAADWSTLPLCHSALPRCHSASSVRCGSPQPLRPSVRWSSLKRRPGATVQVPRYMAKVPGYPGTSRPRATAGDVLNLPLTTRHRTRSSCILPHSGSLLFDPDTASSSGNQIEQALRIEAL